MITVEEFLNQSFSSLVIKSDKNKKYLSTLNIDFSDKTIKEGYEAILINLLDVKNSERPSLTMSLDSVFRLQSLLEIIYSTFLKHSFSVQNIHIVFNFPKNKIGINVPSNFNIIEYLSEDVYQKLSKAKYFYACSIDVKKVSSALTKHNISVSNNLKQACYSSCNNMISGITNLSTLSEADQKFFIETKLYLLRLSAYSRKLEFNITYSHMKKLLTRKTCYYLNTPMSLRDITIDRIDNLKGYTKDNTVACCSEANGIKNQLIEQSYTPTSFLERIVKLRKEGKLK